MITAEQHPSTVVNSEFEEDRQVSTTVSSFHSSGEALVAVQDTVPGFH